uniref:NADH-ubiquinone oxidoreductase chain 4 n=1 Tax=Paroligoneurus sp. QL-2014 TaxID=1491722 RepID=A0A0U1WEH6_9HYME|nr:NADH dehydrogenase subunit 4 [Paroligoneurus sp. QL-2014]
MMKMIFMTLMLLLMYNYKFKNFLILMNTMFMMIMMMPKFNLFNKIYLKMSIDTISFSLMILSILIINFSMLANIKFIKIINNIYFISLMYLLIMSLLLCFSSMNLFMFYIFFEVSLIPMMLLIMGWGMQIDRIQASLYMLFYTLFGSLPFIIMMIFMINYYNSLSMYLMSMNYLNMVNFMMWIMINLAFLIKMPMYLIHLWLPKAHVEAPISGSMILAGIMLKLGTYGIYRMMTMMPILYKKFNLYIIIINIMGSLYSSFICMNNSDLKIIVAYSSIVHMGMMMAGMMSMLMWGFKGSILMMTAHGVCSSGMFCLVNFMYERSSSRNMYLNKGLVNIFPSMTLWWFLICSSNFSAPPSMNLFSEIMIFNSMMIWMKYLMVMIMLIIFFSTYYSINLYSYSQHGTPSISIMNMMNMNCLEFLISSIHWLIINIMFMNMFIYF